MNITQTDTEIKISFDEIVFKRGGVYKWLQGNKTVRVIGLAQNFSHYIEVALLDSDATFYVHFEELYMSVKLMNELQSKI